MAPLKKEILDVLLRDADSKGKKIEALTSGLQRAEAYMVGISIVAAIGFVSLLLTGWAFFSDSINFKSSTYQSLVDKVTEVNHKLDEQQIEKENQELISLREEIKLLKLRNPYLK